MKSFWMTQNNEDNTQSTHQMIDQMMYAICAEKKEELDTTLCDLYSGACLHLQLSFNIFGWFNRANLGAKNIEVWTKACG